MKQRRPTEVKLLMHFLIGTLHGDGLGDLFHAKSFIKNQDKDRITVVWKI